MRVLAGFVILYAAIYLVRLVMGVGPNMLMRYWGASPDFRAFIGATLNYGVGIASCILFPAIALRRVLHVDPWACFYPFRKGWWKDLLCGLLLVTAALSLVFLAAVRLKWLSIQGWNWNALSGVAWLRVAWVGLLVNVGVAIGEETVFRGYLLTGLRATWGKWMGLVAMTIIFGLFHVPAYLSNGMRSMPLMLGMMLATAFGLLFGLVYLRTGSLWLPASLHFGWNFLENDLLNLPADSHNPNLIGALTTSSIDPGAMLMLEVLAFIGIALATGWWLRRRWA